MRKTLGDPERRVDPAPRNIGDRRRSEPTL
jgi:hypothetical protein